jgi:exosortase
LTELNPQAPQAPLVPDYTDELAALDASGSNEHLGLSLDAWVKIGVLTPLFLAVYWLVLRWLWDKTNPIWGEANWGHSAFIPLAGLYYLFIKRDELKATPVEVSWFGLIFIILGLVSFAAGIYPLQNQFFQGCAMILTLFGVVLFLCGWKIMKIAYFPIIYLVCGVPWPPLVYSYVASPLQELAARVAVVSLRFTGVNAYRTGTKINMGGITEPLRTLNVAEACAGMRSLMTFITVGVAVAFLSARPLWQKLIITLSAIPIAIFCNVMRVAGQGLLDHYVSRQLSESFAHQFVGLVMLVPAFFLILLVSWILDHLFVEEIDDPAERKRAMAPAILEIPRHAPLPAMIPPSRHIAPKAASAGIAPPAVAKTQPAAPAVAPTPAQTPAKPPQAAPPAVIPQSPAPAAPAPASAPAMKKPFAPVPPRPAGAPPTPPRPGIVPPRPGAVRPPPTPPPPQNRPPQPPKEGT